MKYKTAHEIARELLAGPDVMMVVAMPVFDMPGCSHALPVKTRLQTVEGRECIIVSAGGGGEETADPEPGHSATEKLTDSPRETVQ